MHYDGANFTTMNKTDMVSSITKLKIPWLEEEEAVH